MGKKVAFSEVARHDKTDDAWVVVNGQVYDMTEFAPSHPGGPDIIYRFAGSDASQAYSDFHPPSLIQQTLDKRHHIGPVDESTVADKLKEGTSEDKAGGGAWGSQNAEGGKPPLHSIINLHDFEQVARQTLSKRSWAYIYGGSNDNITRDANGHFLNRIWLRPAVMRNVEAVNTGTRLFGCDLDLPVYISPTGAAVTAGPEGELALARGAGAGGIVHCISTPASYPHAEILDATPKHAFFQLYVNKDRARSEAAVRQVAASGKVRALFVTADLPVVSKREADERVNADLVGFVAGGSKGSGSGLARQTGSFIDPTLTWDDLAWLRGLTDLPIVVKGIQRAEDARTAMRLGCQGIVVSNHGGRAADGAPPGILALLELHKSCPEVFGAMEVLVDGGFRRGSDVLKAICLGASAVGLGRSFLYASGYGREGVEHAVEILKDEVETAMRLCGLTDLMRDACPDHVNTADVDHLVPGTRHPYARKVTKIKSML